MFDPGPFMYMDKIAVGPSCRGLINIEKPVEENLKIIAKAKGIRPQDLTVVVLDRPRHVELVKKIRGFGARIRFIDDGDVAGALMTSLPESGIDVLIGVGGTPEGVLAACALRAMGGEIQGKLFARNDDELKAGIEMGYDFEKVELKNKSREIEDDLDNDDELVIQSDLSDKEFDINQIQNEDLNEDLNDNKDDEISNYSLKTNEEVWNVDPQVIKEKL